MNREELLEVIAVVDTVTEKKTRLCDMENVNLTDAELEKLYSGLKAKKKIGTMVLMPKKRGKK